MVAFLDFGAFMLAIVCLGVGAMVGAFVAIYDVLAYAEGDHD